MANELYSRVPHTGQERGTRPGQNVLEVRFLTAGPPALLQSRLLGTGVRLAATVATMDSSNFPHWLQAVLALSGGVGLFVVAFLDSTFIPFPTVNDLLLITLSIRTPARMPYYAAMVTLGSTATRATFVPSGETEPVAPMPSMCGTRATSVMAPGFSAQATAKMSYWPSVRETTA